MASRSRAGSAVSVTGLCRSRKLGAEEDLPIWTGTCRPIPAAYSNTVSPKPGVRMF